MEEPGVAASGNVSIAIPPDGHPHLFFLCDPVEKRSLCFVLGPGPGSRSSGVSSAAIVGILWANNGLVLPDRLSAGRTDVDPGSRSAGTVSLGNRTVAEAFILSEAPA